MEAQYATVWERNSDVIPDKIALICGDKEVTWREYDNRAARLATILSEAGLGDDSKVGLYLHNSNEYLEAQYSVFKIRGVPINVNYRYKEEELIYLLDNSDSESKCMCWFKIFNVLSEEFFMFSILLYVIVCLLGILK